MELGPKTTDFAQGAPNAPKANTSMKNALQPTILFAGRALYFNSRLMASFAAVALPDVCQGKSSSHVRIERTDSVTIVLLGNFLPWERSVLPIKSVLQEWSQLLLITRRD